ncbi:MAG TPA: RICIN domain-containing protein, partial [Chitinispirillaceae bacterium]|nr:RICIN domain-containing protein [Chitinispirillaceae bacterium]
MVTKRTNLSIIALFLFFLYSVSSAQITYTLHRETNPTQDQQDAYGRIKTAMDSAVGYYNKYTTITKTLDVHYNLLVGTADANFNGTIRFGSNRSYMVVHTAMHEIAHTAGIGTTNEYWNFIKNGDFTGKHGTEMLRDITSDPDAVLHGDSTHFWPYGLNFAHEVESDNDLVNHCKIVNAIYKDMFNEEFYKVCHLRSHQSGMCIVSDGSTLKLGDCNDSSSLVRLISLNDENVFRLEFGNRVLDIPNESGSAGVAASLYSWNGGGHQRVIFEFESDNLVRLKMVHSGLYLRADGERIIQDNVYESP